MAYNPNLVSDGLTPGGVTVPGIVHAAGLSTQDYALFGNADGQDFPTGDGFSLPPFTIDYVKHASSSFTVVLGCTEMVQLFHALQTGEPHATSSRTGRGCEK